MASSGRCARDRIGPACACVLAGLSVAAAAPAARAAVQVKTWPQVGQWQTSMRVTSDGKYGCVADFVPEGRVDGRTFAVSLMKMPAHDLQLLLSDFGPPRARPDRLRVFIDGVQLGDFPVVQVINEPEGASFLVDLGAGGVYLQDLERKLRTARKVSIVGGSAAYDVPIEAFDAVKLQLTACTGQAFKLDMLVRGPPRYSKPAETVTPPAALAGRGAPAALSPAAIRGVEQVDGRVVQAAVNELVRVRHAAGFAGAVERSKHCFADFDRAPSWGKGDECLALDVAGFKLGATHPGAAGDYFSADQVGDRSETVIARLGGDPYIQVAHINLLRSAAEGELRRVSQPRQAQSALPAQAAKPLPAANLTPQAGAPAFLPPDFGIELGVRSYLKVHGEGGDPAAEALSRRCYANLVDPPAWGDAEPCLSMDESAWELADGMAKLTHRPITPYFTRQAVAKRQAETAARALGRGPEVQARLERLRTTTDKILGRVIDQRLKDKQDGAH